MHCILLSCLLIRAGIWAGYAAEDAREVTNTTSKFHERRNYSDDPYCNKTCHGDADCNQASGCMICDYTKSGKWCMTRSENCGGPPTARNTSLPQFLAIGDSITYGWFPHARAFLENIVESHLVTRNAGPTSEGCKCIDIWLGPDLERWDIITFNFGAWDTARQKSGAGGTPLPKYISNLKNISEKLLQTKAGKTGKLIYLLTTPSANINACCPANHTHQENNFGTLSCPSLIRQYNAAAVEMLQALKVPAVINIDNVWSWINEHCCGAEDCWYTSCDFQPEHGSCDVHFDGANGWEYLAQNVSATVKEVLHRPQTVT